MSSLLTNTSAMVALQTLQSVQSQLSTTQDQVSTGLRVSKASDNAAYWSIATTMKSDNGALSAVSDALGLGSSTVNTAYTGLQAEIDDLNQIKDQLVSATEPGTDRAKVQTQITQILQDMKQKADGSVFNNQNWLSVDSTNANYNSTASIVGSFTRINGAVSVGTIGVNVDSIKLYDVGTSGSTGGILDKTRTAGTTTSSVQSIDISGLTDSSTDLQTLQNYVSIVDGALSDMTNAASTLGAVQNRITSQQTFVSNLMDTINQGVGTLVDANMEQASSRLTALQTQQQLATQSLSIANSSSQSILKLFQG